MTSLDRRLCVAPMLDWTDRHCRAFHRLLTRRAVLYTEMAVDQALIHGDPDRLIAFDPLEQPVAVQLGGSQPELLARAARIAEGFGYAEINLNVGCPSDRVQSGRFGACLMLDPELVRDCLLAMREAVSVPVTVKHRLGVDDQDAARTLPAFVETVATSGVTTFIVHARSAWLGGLSPKQNREVPPLDYPLVRRLKAERPDLEIILNGGLGEPGPGLRRGVRRRRRHAGPRGLPDAVGAGGRGQPGLRRGSTRSATVPRPCGPSGPTSRTSWPTANDSTP